MTSWSVEIRKVLDSKTVWCFPYNNPVQFPPYPGFNVLENFLDKYYKDIIYERLYNDGSPVLAVTFGSEHDAFCFILSAGQVKIHD